MERKNLLEKLENEIDLQKEYEKIESLILQPIVFGRASIEDDIERYYKNWRHKAIYLSFYKIREQLGFTYGFNEIVASQFQMHW